ncbi:hypothetical protein CSR02_13580 [Acetobacter pomorum]|uniref:Uncharacterized protein n=1 Tax=Acetobacter pomorum TaxID=65959 RepID=A0A2G4R930_9PROT|nr:hypothetical protein CSR02_13580 [Acetobacter pomorum]
MASACLSGHAGLCRHGKCPVSGKLIETEKNTTQNTIIVVRWSIQEIRRLVVKLTQRRLPVSHILRWSVFRRTHQASAIRAHSRHKMQL